ncbi:methylaspartate mutase [Streptomyces xanthochromogenes]|uniref:cobalamin B12-binding domain-containing protein n=1 Tax=Streptomyces TaxID=1883 RepID=UPI00142052FC|nr:MULTISPECIES: cobalamin-dependent protein [Streptomyces]GHB62054.1 methylaspartate mutase [Streptomyces xanthochromogenes]
MSTSFRCLVSTVESDSHIWNLVYLQKLLEENGATVRNLGSCTPVDLVVRAVRESRPELLVVSSVNGHGHHGARVLLSALQENGLEVPCVVGGKLTTTESDNDRVRRDLLAHGYTDVFLGEDAIPRFRDFLTSGRSEGFARWQADAAVVPPWDATVSAAAGVH